MGVLDVFRKTTSEEKEAVHKFKESLRESFGRIKEDIDSQNSWISYLHNDLHSHKSQVHSHIQNHHTNLNQVREWIEYLHKSNSQLKKDIDEVERSIHAKIRKDLALYTQHISSIVKSHYESINTDEMQKKIDALEARIRDLEARQPAAMTRTAQPEDISIEIQEDKRLNLAQQKILNLLYSSNIPLSYEAIAQKLGISVISARVYIKKLRDLGIDIETLNNSGKKSLLTISNKEKVKKFYNY